LSVGFRYNPITSDTLASNSAENLNVSIHDTFLFVRCVVASNDLDLLHQAAAQSH
jgi:hypothetical protein